MTTMLEKMARAIWAETAPAADFHGNGVGTFDEPENEATVEDAYVAARAALLAIREPDEAIRLAGWEGRDEFSNPPDAFTPMIDAILNEKPEAGTT